MHTSLMSPEDWAREEFGGAALGDRRRARRLVRVAGRVAASPGGTLCSALPDWAELHAAYRLMNGPAVTHGKVLADHFRRTRERCAALPEGLECLLIEDTTAADFTAHRDAEGLGRIGDDGGRGFYVHTTLAAVMREHEEGGAATGEVAATAELVGLFDQRWWARGDKPPGGGAAGERKASRLSRARESQRWAACLSECPPACLSGEAPPPGPGRWTFVADREGDVYEVLSRCRELGVAPLIRACQDRALCGEGAGPHAGPHAGPPGHLFAAVRAAPVKGTYELRLRARPGQAARMARVQVRSAAVTLRPPWRPAGFGRDLGPVEVNVIEAWEPDPPEGAEPLHWVLLTTWPADTLAQCRRAVRAYGLRFLIEDFHKALKTGCGLEKSQLATAQALAALLGVLSLVAARLLDLKLMARARPDEPVTADRVGPEPLAVLGHRFGEPAGGWTHRTTLRAVARLGGFLARKGDGEPGWITIWRGWKRLNDLCEGYAIALAMAKSH